MRLIRWVFADPRRALGSVFVALPIIGPLWNGLIRLLDWAGRIEFVMNHETDLSGLFDAVWAFILQPPGWAIWTALALGFGLLFLGKDPTPNERGTSRAARPASRATAVHTRSLSASSSGRHSEAPCGGRGVLRRRQGRDW